MVSTTNSMSVPENAFRIPTPIDKLPNEVLSRIFLLVNLKDRWYPGIKIADPRTPVRIFMQVSSRWRSVALSYPRLWSQILLDYDRCGRKEIPMIGQFLEQCLLLSRECPLNIRVEGRVRPHWLGESCLKALARSIYRWETIDIEDNANLDKFVSFIDEPSYTYTSLRTLRLKGVSSPVDIRPTPNLIKLDICKSVVDSDQLDLSKTPITLQSTPSLRILRLHKVVNHTAILKFIPLRQITELHLEYNMFYDDHLAKLLEQMPNIQSFTFGGVINAHLPLMPTPHITLPQVSFFKIHRSVYDEFVDPLKRFTMPKLKHLEFRFNVSSYDTIVHFVRRSKCTLESIKLKCLRREDKGSEWTGNELSELKSLFIDMPAKMKHGIQLKTMQVLSDCTIFPNLERLEIMAPEDFMKGFTKKIVWMLQTRLESIAPTLTTRRLRSAKTRPADKVVNRLKYVHVMFPLEPVYTDDGKVVKEFLRSDFYNIARRAGVVIEFSYDTRVAGTVFYHAP